MSTTPCFLGWALLGTVGAVAWGTQEAKYTRPTQGLGGHFLFSPGT